MSTFKMSFLGKKLPYNHLKCIANKRYNASILFIASRNLSVVPSIYDGEKDPAPKFFSKDVQNILKRLTRPDFTKVFRKRTNSGLAVLKTPAYKFLTNEELEAEMKKAYQRADQLLQLPPVVKIQSPIDEVLSKDPALTGHDTAKYVFTDITFGIPNKKRIIVERDLDGTLRSCDNEVRKRLNETYFPTVGRKIRDPKMFTNEDLLNRLLDTQKYEFVLDRACIQYEPDELMYQKITSITYQHLDAKCNYNCVRSTRHFGPMAFYLSWHQSAEGLLLELLHTGIIREGALLIALRHKLHGDVGNGETALQLTDKIFETPIIQSRLEQLTEEDIQLDNQCVDLIQDYITKNSSMRGQQELALQGFRETFQSLVDLSRGLRTAHGNA